MSEHYRETRYGFEWGAATVERQISHKGAVQFVVVTPRQELTIYVTPTGLIRAMPVVKAPRNPTGIPVPSPTDPEADNAQTPK